MTKRVAYFAGLAAAVAGGALAGTAYVWRAYRRTRAVGFEFQGAHYVRHPDGRFTTSAGLPVHGPQLEQVAAHFRSMRL